LPVFWLIHSATGKDDFGLFVAESTGDPLLFKMMPGRMEKAGKDESICLSP